MSELTDQIDAAKKLLADNGFAVLRAKSYHQARERQRVAEARRHYAEESEERTYRWVRDQLSGEIRELRERCTFLYGAARAHGATVDELRGDV